MIEIYRETEIKRKRRSERREGENKEGKEREAGGGGGEKSKRQYEGKRRQLVIKKMVNKVGIISLHEYISLLGINMCCIILFTSLLSFYLPLSLFSSLFFSCLPNNRLLYSLISSLLFSSYSFYFILSVCHHFLSFFSSLLFLSFLSLFESSLFSLIFSFHYFISFLFSFLFLFSLPCLLFRLSGGQILLLCSTSKWMMSIVQINFSCTYSEQTRR